VVAIGGIPKKSPLVMQILADVLAIPVKVASSSQAVALGVVIFASAASGYYSDTETAQASMASNVSKTYLLDKENVGVYRRLYVKYRKLGDSLEDMLRSL